MNGHFFQINNRYYAFDEEELMPLSLDEKAYDYLKNVQEFKLEIDQSHQQDLTELLDANILFKQYPIERFQLVNSKSTGRVSFPTIRDCNFKCQYCFASSGNNFIHETKEMTIEALKNILDFLYFDYFKEYNSIRFDFVSGGEPLLNYPIIQKLNGLLKEYNERTKKTSFIWVCTNGSLLQDSITEYLEKEHIGLGISFEGIQEYQDNMRPFSNGEGSYEVVLSNINQILSSDTLSGFTKKFWALGVITSQTRSIIELVEAYKRAGITNLQLKFCRLPQNTDICLSVNECEKLKKLYFEFSEYLKQELTQKNTKTLFMILNKNDAFGKYLLRLILREPTMRRCGAGLNKISLCTNGDVYPCDSFVGIEKYCMGNIYHGIKETKINYALTIYSSNNCRNCWARFVCGGDCYHNAYETTGSITEPIDYFCDLYKYLIELSIDLCCFISELDGTTQKLIEKGAIIRNEHF